MEHTLIPRQEFLLGMSWFAPRNLPNEQSKNAQCNNKLNRISPIRTTRDNDLGGAFTTATAHTVSGGGCVPMRSRALPAGAEMATEVGSYTKLVQYSSTIIREDRRDC